MTQGEKRQTKWMRAVLFWVFVIIFIAVAVIGLLNLIGVVIFIRYPADQLVVVGHAAFAQFGNLVHGFFDGLGVFEYQVMTELIIVYATGDLAMG